MKTTGANLASKLVALLRFVVLLGGLLLAEAVAFAVGLVLFVVGLGTTVVEWLEVKV